MKHLVVILVLVAATVSSGCYVAAIPRFKVIKRPVTTTELAGRWVLSTESQRAMAVDGFSKKAGQEFAIFLRPDGSCSYRTVLGRAYVEREGQWSIRFEPSDHYKNRLDFRFQDEVVSLMSVALDSSGTALFEPWGDPDAGIDLVYHKQPGGEPDGAANGSQPIRSETNRTSSAADSRR